jgi:hypothetical protein
MLKRLLLIVLAFFCFGPSLHAQSPVFLSDTINQHIFSHHEIQFLEDPTNKLSFSDITSPAYVARFRSDNSNTPQTSNFKSTYWFRVKLKDNPASHNGWMLEFFDQTIDNIVVYSPGPKNTYTPAAMGAEHPFNLRLYQHKNFSLNISNHLPGQNIYYIRVKSHQPTNVIVVLKSVSWFIHYALDEYFFFGVFYGMILVFSLYNLMMFIAIRQKQYLYYIMYNLSIGMYEMSADGIAYQYIWSNSPIWNQYAYGVFLFCASIFALMFTQSLLFVKSKAPVVNKIIWWVIAVRCAFFLTCLLINKNWFNYKVIEIVPLLLAYYTGYHVLRKGYWPARFFIIGYSFLLAGFLIKLLIALDVPWLPFGPVTHYSLSFCFIMEMLFISFAIGEKVRALKKKKDYAQRRIINQMRQNEELKDIINRKLEEQVKERTKEVIEKSILIEQQNDELRSVNDLLKEQAEEISRMNVLLEKDNITLHHNIEKVTHDRVMSADVDYEEFSQIYPDREACFKFLADLKWESGYACRKCNSDHYCNGHLPYSRRCTKCGYEESVIANTILQNTRIPVNKAFYIIFLTYSTKGKISSYKLSELLSIRQSTCWAYSSRVKKAMLKMKKELKNAGNKGWSKLVFEMVEE